MHVDPDLDDSDSSDGPQRRRSFGDAEDLITRVGLHHRIRTPPSKPREYRTPTPKRKPAIHAPRRRSKWVKWGLVISFGSYALLLWTCSEWLLRYPPTRPFKRVTPPPPMEVRRRVKETEQAVQRRQRTRPGGGLGMTSTISDWYALQRMGGESSSKPTSPGPALASTDRLCGFVAQQASLKNPDHYPTSTALQEARVLITGILSPLGFNLAMHLRHHCGVQVIGGIDLMYPNTVQHRLQLVQDQLQLLHTTIPGLIRPISLAFLGVEPKNADLPDWQPTHIVHLASYSPDLYSLQAVDPSWRNMDSPYRDAPFFMLRSSLIAMEQLLQHIVQQADVRPHFLYASSSTTSSSFGTVKLMDEILVQAYQFPSIALRLPDTIFGPWGHPGSVVHNLMESTRSIATNETLQLLHVDDAVEAIVAAMQFQPSQPMALDITSAASHLSTQTLAHFLDTLSTNLTLLSAVPPKLDTLPPALLEWQPRVPLTQGLIQTKAWYLHRRAPFGPATETADDFLRRHKLPTCHANDWSCHKSKQYLPCASECNTRQQCLPSIFDEILPLISEVSEGCDIVLYTQSLGHNVKDMKLHSEYVEVPRDKDKMVCNFAFVPRDSTLVSTVVSKVPNDQLAKFGITPQVGADMKTKKLDGLNGRLLYRGWILLWVKDATKPLSVADRTLLKLSPSRLFHSDVGRAIFMEENFSVSPTLEDVLFLVGEMNRKPLPKRTVKRDVKARTPYGKEVVQRKKYRIPPEPRRRAAILFAPLRIPNDPHDETVKGYKNGDKKMSVHDAAKFMRYELEIELTEREGARKQREFYEKVPSYINRNNELRSINEPWYRYNLRHWVRTRWVVHDTHLQESRLLRCDWYQEHLAWGTELDQLSVAHVLAMRELKRRIAHHEPDDHFATFFEKHPALKDLTDSYEWYPMETDANQLYLEPVQWTSTVPDHVTVEEDEAIVEEEEEPHENPKEPTPLFVRIMSERVMTASRKVFSKNRKPTKKKRKK